MPRLLFALLLTTVFVTAGLAAPTLAAEDAAPPPPIDWSDVTGGPADPDLEVGEEMC